MAEQIDDCCNFGNINECSICMERFVKPKCLPCMHTFCLKCLEKYGKEHADKAAKQTSREYTESSSRNAEDELTCPICRQMFKIPPDGFETFPDNMFVEKILQLGISSSVSTEIDQCDICHAKEIAKFCVECDQKFCDECSTYHEKLRASQYHTVKSIATSHFLMQARAAFCDEHKNDLLRLYCYDCNKAICPMCAALSHEHHKRVDLSDSSRQFCDQLQKNLPKLESCIADNDHELKLVNDNETSLMKLISERERSVIDRATVIKRLIDVECSQLLEQLANFKIERLKDIQTRKDDLDRQNTILDRFKTNVKEVMVEGSPCYISQRANDLLNKAKELLTLQDEFKKQASTSTSVIFIEERLDDILNCRFKFIGWMLFNEDEPRVSKPTCAELKSSLSAAQKEVAEVRKKLLDLQTSVDDLTEKLSEDDKVKRTLNQKLCESNNENKRLQEKLHKSGVEGVLVVSGFACGPAPSMVQQVCHISLEWTNSVNVIGATPAEVGLESAACVVGNTLYAVGIGERSNELWKWHPVSGWLKCANLLLPRRRHCAAVVDSTLYTIGGWHEQTRTARSSIEAYDTETKEWHEAGRLKRAVQKAAFVVYTNSIYVFGGSDKDNDLVADVQIYSTGTDTCKLMANSMLAVSSSMRAVLWNTFAILVCNTNCYIYDLESEDWQSSCNYNYNGTGVIDFGLVIENDTLYIAGGRRSHKTRRRKETVWILTDEIKSMSVHDIMKDNNSVWKLHAKLPQPAAMHAFCNLPLPFLHDM